MGFQNNSSMLTKNATGYISGAYVNTFLDCIYILHVFFWGNPTFRNTGVPELAGDGFGGSFVDRYNNFCIYIYIHTYI